MSASWQSVRTIKYFMMKMLLYHGKGVERMVRYEEEMLMRAELLIRCELCESLIWTDNILNNLRLLRHMWTQSWGDMRQRGEPREGPHQNNKNTKYYFLIENKTLVNKPSSCQISFPGETVYFHCIMGLLITIRDVFMFIYWDHYVLKQHFSEM